MNRRLQPNSTMMNMDEDMMYISTGINTSCCVLSCEGRTHDVSNLICREHQYQQYVVPKATQLTSSTSWSPGCSAHASLYPNLRAIEDDDSYNCEAPPSLREWMSDSDYIYSKRTTHHQPQHAIVQHQTQDQQPQDQPREKKANRVSFSSEDMIIDIPNDPAAEDLYFEEEDYQLSYYQQQEQDLEEDDDEDHPLLEIAPGMRVPYIGTAERTRALIKYSVKEQRTTMQVVCFSCQAGLVCMAGMEYVACIACHTVSPLAAASSAPHNDDQQVQRGAGIGLLLEEAELLKRRAHNTDFY